MYLPHSAPQYYYILELTSNTEVLLIGLRSRLGVWDGLSTIKLALDMPPLVFLYKTQQCLHP